MEVWSTDPEFRSEGGILGSKSLRTVSVDQALARLAQTGITSGVAAR